jgi:hypothetical protein
VAQGISPEFKPQYHKKKERGKKKKLEEVVSCSKFKVQPSGCQEGKMMCTVTQGFSGSGL